MSTYKNTTNNQHALHPFLLEEITQERSVPKHSKVLPTHTAVVLPSASAMHPYSFTPSHTLT